VWQSGDDLLMLGVAKSWEPETGIGGLVDMVDHGFEVRMHLRPLIWVMWAFAYQAYGDDAKAFARVSLTLHFLAGLVLLLLILQMLPSLPAVGVVASAMYFLSHPLHYDLINWLPTQEDLTHGVLYIGATALYVRWLDDRTRVASYAGAIVAGGVALFAKEFIATLPVVLAIWTVVHERRARDIARRIPALVPFALLPVAVSLLRAILLPDDGGGPAFGPHARWWLFGMDAVVRDYVGGFKVEADVLAHWVWLLPCLLGQPFLRLYLMAEHGRCAFSANIFENTRTTLTNRIIRFLAWNMPYHTEHHALPQVPFHNLPALHAEMQGHHRVLARGYLRVTREGIASLR